MNLVFSRKREVADMVARNIPGCSAGFGECEVVGFKIAGELVGGLVYHNYNPEAGVIEISGYSNNPRWLTKPMLNFMFNYPFEIGCQTIVMRVDPDNNRLIRQLGVVGFRFYEIPNLRGRSKPERICTLLDDDWFNCKLYNGQFHKGAKRVA